MKRGPTKVGPDQAIEDIHEYKLPEDKIILDISDNDKVLFINMIDTNSIEGYYEVHRLSDYIKDKQNYGLMSILAERKGIRNNIDKDLFIDDDDINLFKNDSNNIFYNYNSNIYKSSQIIAKSAALLHEIFYEINSNNNNYYIIRGPENENNPYKITENFEMENIIFNQKFENINLDNITLCSKVTTEYELLNMNNNNNKENCDFTSIINKYDKIKIIFNGPCGFYDILSPKIKELFNKKIIIMFINNFFPANLDIIYDNINIKNYKNYFYNVTASLNLLNDLKIINKYLINYISNIDINDKENIITLLKKVEKQKIKNIEDLCIINLITNYNTPYNYKSLINFIQITLNDSIKKSNILHIYIKKKKNIIYLNNK